MLSTQRGLSQDNQLFIGKLKQLDLRSIAYELMHASEGEKLTFEQTKQALNHYSMFLCLINLYPERQLVPTQQIDRVWHSHILDTMKYAEDCQMLFGRFIHHFPYLGKRGKVDQKNLYTAFRETQKLFQQHFNVDLAVIEEPLQIADCQPVVYAQKMTRPVVAMKIDYLGCAVRV
ncbi:MAG: glycine-rich domain-containing protein-like [Cyanobacteriota bacterium]|nr:glycine-rich domain-containing protein-like [Cyanobacteriota bacterium]